MANPQWENGFIKIATEIWDALCAIRIPGEARQVLDAIIRKTYGWNQKKDYIPLSQLSEMTGLKRPNVVRAVKRLVEMNLISVIKNDNSYINLYSFNKDYESWDTVIKSDTSTVIKNDNKTVIKSDTLNIQLNTLKDTNSNFSIQKKIKKSLEID